MKILAAVHILAALAVATGQRREDAALAGLVALVDEDEALRSVLLEELSAANAAKESDQQMLAGLEHLRAASSRLRQEVRHLQDGAQAEEGRGAATTAEATAAVATLEQHRRAARLMRAAARRGVQASRLRLCEALTRGRGQLAHLCRAASREPEGQDWEEVLRRLHQDPASRRAPRRGTPALLVMLAVLWAAWALMMRLLVRRRRRGKEE